MYTRTKEKETKTKHTRYVIVSGIYTRMIHRKRKSQKEKTGENRGDKKKSLDGLGVTSHTINTAAAFSESVAVDQSSTGRVRRVLLSQAGE